MRERDRLSLKAHRDEIEAQERAERERIEAPIRAAENKLQENHRKLAAVMRERLLGKVADPNRIPIDPAVSGIKMTQHQAAEFNRSEFRDYRDVHPHVYWTPELVDQVSSYFDANGLRIVTANMIGAIVARYRDAGLLPDPPQPEPEPQPTEPETEPSGPPVYIGRDFESGRDREFTQREIDRMSADEYRRAFPVANSFSRLFSAMKEGR